MKKHVLTCCVILLGIFSTQSVLAESKYRKDWQEAKKEFEKDFKEAYKKAVTDKKLDDKAKKKLGLDEGDSRKKYIKLGSGAKFGNNLDSWDEKYKKYKEERDKYESLGWDGLHASNPTLASDLAEKIYSTTHGLWVAVKDLNHTSASADDIKDVISQFPKAKDLNISKNAKTVWDNCTSGCDTSEEVLRSTLLDVRTITMTMQEGSWRDAIDAFVKTDHFKELRESVDTEVKKVETSCETYDKRIDTAKKKIKEKGIDKALKDLDKVRKKLCSDVTKKYKIQS